MGAMNLWVELDQEPFPLEAQFADLGPVEGIYFCGALKNLKAHVSNSQIDFGNRLLIRTQCLQHKRMSSQRRKSTMR